MRETRILLDNIRSVHNVGSIFRTAECADVTKIYCIGTTPVPIDCFGRKRKDFAKVSLGAEDLVKWEHLDDEGAIKMIKQLKKERFNIVAIEQCKNSTDIYEFKAGPKTLFILGNEVVGVSLKLVAAADVAVEIPMKGKKESLNVSVAAGVVLFSRH